MGNVILEVKDLKVSFYKRRREGQAVRDVNFTLEEGQTLGIIGESGSGKSVSGMSVMGLVPSIGGKIRSGEIIYEGTDLLKLSPKEMRKIQGNKIAMIFQEPMTSLTPVFTVGYQLPPAHAQGGSRKARRGVDADGWPFQPGKACAAISASALWRDAPARDDCHGAGMSAEHTDCR